MNVLYDAVWRLADSRTNYKEEFEKTKDINVVYKAWFDAAEDLADQYYNEGLSETYSEIRKIIDEQKRITNYVY